VSLNTFKQKLKTPVCSDDELHPAFLWFGRRDTNVLTYLLTYLYNISVLRITTEAFGEWWKLTLPYVQSLNQVNRLSENYVHLTYCVALPSWQAWLAYGQRVRVSPCRQPLLAWDSGRQGQRDRQGENILLLVQACFAWSIMLHWLNRGGDKKTRIVRKIFIIIYMYIHLTTKCRLASDMLQ